MNQQPNNLEIVTAGDIGTLALSSIQSFSKRHKVISTSYVYGLTTLLLLALLGSGTKLTIDQQRQYNSIMNTIDLQAEYSAASAYHTAYSNYYHSKGWISCDAHCQHYKRIMERKKYEWDEIKAEEDDTKGGSPLQITAHHFQYAFEHVLPSVSKKDQARYDKLRDRMARARTRGGAGSTATAAGRGDASDVESSAPPPEVNNDNE